MGFWIVKRFFYIAAVMLLVLSGAGQALSGIGDDGIDLIFVIDNSGSMRKNDPGFMTLATVKAFLDQLPPETRVGMVMFGRKAKLLEPLGDMSNPVARERILSSLDRIDYSGQFTNSAAGIERALYELKTGGRSMSHKCIIFLTDGIIDTGRPQRDIELTDWLKNDLAAAGRLAGVRIFGIAFTDEADFALIQAVSSRTEGAYYRVYDPNEIGDVLRQVQAKMRPAPDTGSKLTSDSESTDETDVADTEVPASLDTAAPAVPAPGAGADTFSRFYLPLLIVAFVLLGLVVFFVYKIWGQPLKPVSRRRRMASVGRSQVSEAASELPGWQLHDMATEDGGNILNFNSLGITIGRGEKNDLVVDHPTVSNLHATIQYKDGAFYLEDQRSTNGTRLNDRPIAASQPVRLKSGDRVAFSNFEYRFVRLDQLISGETVMLSAAAADAVKLAGKASANNIAGHNEQQLAECLKKQLARIGGIGDKFKTFVENRFSEEIIRAVSIQAHANMKQTLSDGSQQCSPIIKGRVFFLVCTLPVPLADAAGYFTEQNDGFVQFIHKWILSEAFDVTSCDVFCVVTFGLDTGPWASVTIVPTTKDETAVEIMSVDFLTEAEKKALALEFDGHGQVI